MIIKTLPILGAYEIDPQSIKDDRGYFSRLFCTDEFARYGLENKFVQTNLSYNESFGTLRGMHFQSNPCEETKLIYCVTGSIFDVIVDLRKTSNTYMQWVGKRLSGSNRKIIYVPKGCAHGFLTLCDNTYVMYQISAFYNQGYADGFRYDDPAFNIKWPYEPEIISDRDNNHPPYIL